MSGLLQSKTCFHMVPLEEICSGAVLHQPSLMLPAVRVGRLVKGMHREL